MSEFKEHLDTASRTNRYKHKRCGGEGIVTVSVITELPKPLMDAAKDNPVAYGFLKSQLPMTVRLTKCAKCAYQEAEPVTA